MDSLEYTPVTEYPEQSAKKAYRKAGAALFFCIVAAQLSAVLIIRVAFRFFPQVIDTDWFLLALNFAAIDCIGAAFFFIFIRKAPVLPRERKKMSVGSLICAAFISISCIYVFNIITIVITSLLETVFNTTFPSRLDETLENANLWLAVLSVVVVAPIVEELIYRKLLCDRLAHYGERQAVIFSALAFSLFHANLEQLLYAFTLGCIFGIIYVRTGKLRYTVILHAIVNFVGSVPGLLLLRSDLVDILDRFAVMTGENDTQALLDYFAEHAGVIIPYLLYSLILVFTVVTGIVLGIIFLGKLIRSTDNKHMPKGKGKRIVIMFSGVFTILYIIVSLALTIINLIPQETL